MNIVDYLPEEVYYFSASDPNATYDTLTNTVTWNIGTLEPNEPNSVTLTVKVNQLAEPLGTIRNLCILRANEIRPVFTTEITDVNSWNPPVIYVDASASGSNTGMSWKNAYRDLQKALARTRAGCGSQIWVAAGTYKPTIEPNSLATFQLVNGVPIYGGFNGNETSTSQRNFTYGNNETILEGKYGTEYEQAVLYVVKAAQDVANGLVDGFTIRGNHG